MDQTRQARHARSLPVLPDDLRHVQRGRFEIAQAQKDQRALLIHSSIQVVGLPLNARFGADGPRFSSVSEMRLTDREIVFVCWEWCFSCQSGQCQGASFLIHINDPCS